MKFQKNLVIMLFFLMIMFIYPINVKAATITDISLDHESINLYVGQEYKLTYKLQPQNAGTADIELISYSQKIAKISDNGNISAVNVGKTTIMVRSLDKKVSKLCTVNVLKGVAPTQIILEQQSIQLKPGENKMLTAQVLPKETTDKTVHYISSNASVASVDPNGTITANHEGIAMISAETASSAVSKICIVKVTAKSQDISTTSNISGKLLSENGYPYPNYHINLLNDTNGLETITDEKGNFTFEKLPLGEYTVYFFDNANPSEIIALGEMSVQAKNVLITATVTGVDLNFKYTYPTVISQALKDIELSKNSVNLKIDETYQMIYQTKPAGLDLPKIKAISSNPKVVTVDENGLITAAAEGSAVLSFTTADGKHKQICNIVVEKAESTYYSLLIIVVESILLLAGIIFFFVIYRLFFRMRVQEENKLKE